MRVRALGVGMIVVAALGCSSADREEDVRVGPTTAGPMPATASFAAGQRQVVVFKSATLPGDAVARITGAGGTLRKAIGAIGVATIDADPATVARLAADPAVAAIGAERSWSLPKGVRNATKQAAPPPGSSAGAAGFLWGAQWDQRRIHSPAAWNNVPAQAQGNVTVAVIDTGVMSDHPTVEGRVVDAVTTSYTTTLIGCPDPAGAPPGYPVYSTRINLVNGNYCELALDPEAVQAHGTHVAGTIAGGTSFGAGTAGVGPSLKIAAYKVFDRLVVPDASGPVEILNAFDGPLFEAIADAANKGYPVINMSLGGAIDREDPDQNASWTAWNRVAKLATQKGTLIVAAAGNDAANNNGSLAFIPSDLPAVLSVAASGRSALTGSFPFGPIDPAPGSVDVQAFYSNFGAAVNVAAPGGDCGPSFPNGCEPQYLIVSSVPYFDPGSPRLTGVAWSWYAGTSMASPHVAGVAALVKAKHPTWSPSQVRAKVEQTASPAGSRQAFGRGIVDADLATR